MKIGVKYCGGCNSTYDRSSVYARLVSEHPEHTVETAKDSKEYDLLVVLSGCRVECADISAYKADRTFFVPDEEEYENLKKLL